MATLFMYRQQIFDFHEPRRNSWGVSHPIIATYMMSWESKQWTLSESQGMCVLQNVVPILDIGSVVSESI